MQNIKIPDDFNSKFEVGTPLHYQSIIGLSELKEVTTTSEAWALGHGLVVVSVSGIRGGVCVEHLTEIK